jgi:hypothetical protein
MLGQGGLKSCLSWVPSWNCLTNVGATDSSVAMQPSVNFHHPPGRKFSPSFSNQACSCDIYYGTHSNKGHGNKAAASEPKVCPPVKVGRLAFLSAFWFPWTTGVSPFWCSQQCMTINHLGAHKAFRNFRIFLSIFKTFFPELEVPTGSGYVFNDSVQSHYCISKKSVSFQTKLLPSVKYTMSGWLMGWSVKPGQMENASSIISKQSCSMGLN